MRWELRMKLRFSSEGTTQLAESRSTCPNPLQKASPTERQQGSH